MTISTTLAVTRYAGDGATTVFPTVFKFLQNAHVQVVLRDSAGTETTWSENTEYTLTGAGNDGGGTVTVKTSPADYTPAAGETLVIRRVVPLSQETDYPEGGAFPAATHEDALDLAAMRDQQLSEELARALKLTVSDGDGTIGALPGVVTRAGRFLAFDGNGDPIASVGTSDGLGPVTPYMNTLLDDSDGSAARSTLGVGQGWKRLVAPSEPVAASEVSFTLAGAFDGTYDVLAFPFSNVVPSVDGESFLCQVQTGGSTWRTANYGFIRSTSVETSTTLTQAVGAAEGQITLFAGCGNDIGEVVAGCLFLHDPAKTDVRKIIIGDVVGHDDGSVLKGGPVRAMWNGANTAITGLKFYMGSGTLRGVFGMYGLMRA